MIYHSPENIATRDRSKKSIFLAGSIEMNTCEDWQSPLSKWLVDRGYNVFNPRRLDWDSSWGNEYSDPNFYQQVNWELNALKKADLIIMYFDPNTKSPISLLELGHFSAKKILVVCPIGFYRKGNVDIICDIEDIPLFNSIEELKNSNLIN